jgi:Flp pilus assembly protein TadD
MEHYHLAAAADPTNARAQQGLGAGHAAVGDYPTARLHLEEAVRLAPESGSAWDPGEVLSHSGELGAAQKAPERALTLGETTGEVKEHLAFVFQRQGKAAAARDMARRALRQRLPKDWRAWMAGIADANARRRR